MIRNAFYGGLDDWTNQGLRGFYAASVAKGTIET